MASVSCLKIRKTGMIEMKYVSAFVLGLMSASHCLGMCGGISGAFGLGVDRTGIQRLAPLFAYNSGRVMCYGLLGLLLGSVTQAGVHYAGNLLIPLRVLAGLMLIAMACYISQWWMGLTFLEGAGQYVWRHVQPFSLRLLPVRNLFHAFIFGLLWGFLPCGLVYSVLTWAASSAHPLPAALLMISFGLGTLPVMLASGMVSVQLKNFLQRKMVRQGTAVLLMAYGLWTLYAALQHV
jgi:sulfite exporter TauE/SafE